MAIKNDRELDSRLMDFGGDRYDIVVLASTWAKELRKKSEYKHQPNAVVIKAALDDILTGRKTREEVLRISKENLEAELRAAEEARKEAERKAKEPMKL